MRIPLLAMLLFIAGCGSDRIPTYPVSGRVVFADGAKVRHGTIELESVEYGTTASGAIKQDGSFVLGTYTEKDGAVAGRHRAIVIQIVVADGSFKHTINHGRPAPSRYASYETSRLNVVVQPNQRNEVKITLESDSP